MATALTPFKGDGGKVRGVRLYVGPEGYLPAGHQAGGDTLIQPKAACLFVLQVMGVEGQRVPLSHNQPKPLACLCLWNMDEGTVPLSCCRPRGCF